MTSKDWLAWHAPYDDETSPLARRLRAVQEQIKDFLTVRDEPALTVVSACAGQGRDLLEVLERRPADAARVRARLIELDPRNAALAEEHAARAGLRGVTVVRGDAGDPASYADAVPADLVLMAGVMGNISDDDVHRLVSRLPELCAPGATVLWTRTRESPDLTPTVREWFAGAGFAEIAFVAPEGVLFSVGCHRLVAEPRALVAEGSLFTFV